jgi:hypothetical protein
LDIDHLDNNNRNLMDYIYNYGWGDISMDCIGSHIISKIMIDNKCTSDIYQLILQYLSFYDYLTIFKNCPHKTGISLITQHDYDRILQEKISINEVAMLLHTNIYQKNKYKLKAIYDKIRLLQNEGYDFSIKILDVTSFSGYTLGDIFFERSCVIFMRDECQWIDHKEIKNIIIPTTSIYV